MKYLNLLRMQNLMKRQARPTCTTKNESFQHLVLLKRIAPLPPATTVASPSLAIRARRSPSAVDGSMVRLPKLTIWTFNGKITAWTPFWDSFNSAIHENSELSKIDKFNYLRSMITNGALELFQD